MRFNTVSRLSSVKGAEPMSGGGICDDLGALLEHDFRGALDVQSGPALLELDHDAHALAARVEGDELRILALARSSLTGPMARYSLARMSRAISVLEPMKVLLPSTSPSNAVELSEMDLQEELLLRRAKHRNELCALTSLRRSHRSCSPAGRTLPTPTFGPFRYT